MGFGVLVAAQSCPVFYIGVIGQTLPVRFFAKQKNKHARRAQPNNPDVKYGTRLGGHKGYFFLKYRGFSKLLLSSRRSYRNINSIEPDW